MTFPGFPWPYEPCMMPLIEHHGQRGASLKCSFNAKPKETGAAVGDSRYVWDVLVKLSPSCSSKNRRDSSSLVIITLIISTTAAPYVAGADVPDMPESQCRCDWRRTSSQRATNCAGTLMSCYFPGSGSPCSISGFLTRLLIILLILTRPYFAICARAVKNMNMFFYNLL